MSVDRIPRAQRVRPNALFLGLLFCVIVASLSYWLWTEYIPAWEEADVDLETAAVVANAQVHPGKLLIRDGEPLLLLDFIRDELDPEVQWDEASGSVIFTTSHQVVTMATESLTAMVNRKPLELAYPVEVVDGQVFVPLEPVAELLGIRYQLVSNTNRLLLEEVGTSYLRLRVNVERTVMREEPHIKSAIVRYLAAGDILKTYAEVDSWFRVQTSGGLVGYIREDDVVVESPVIVQPASVPDPLVQRTYLPLGTKINLVWEHVIHRTPRPAEIGELPGVNVVSPTWFYLRDAEGNVGNIADARMNRDTRSGPSFPTPFHLTVRAPYSRVSKTAPGPSIKYSRSPHSTTWTASTWTMRMSTTRTGSFWCSLFENWYPWHTNRDWSSPWMSQPSRLAGTGRWCMTGRSLPKSWTT